MPFFQCARLRHALAVHNVHVLRTGALFIELHVERPAPSLA